VLFDPEQVPEPAAEPNEQQLLDEIEEQQLLSSLLQEQLQKLPDETRRLLEMKHHEGKTCEQIATATGRPVGTIKSLLARTYKSLRDAMSGSGKAGVR
jgi:RNA polymerase sigma-70 factor (ECF subfamily)